MLKKKDWSQLPRRALNPTQIVTRLAALPGWAEKYVKVAAHHRRFD